MKTLEERNAYQREWAKKNRLKVRASKLKWALNNPEKRKASKQAWNAANQDRIRKTRKRREAQRRRDLLTTQSKWRKNNRQKLNIYRQTYKARYLDRELNKAWRREVRRRYGITNHEYDLMLAAQGGCCAICHTASPGGRGNRFHVDHSHITGKLRGLLCGKCNVAIGYMQDDPAVLRQAAAYVEAHGAYPNPSGELRKILDRVPKKEGQARRNEGMVSTEAIT